METVKFSFALFLIIITLVECNTKNECGKLIDYRLPRTVVPEHYDLTLKPDLQSLKFSGEVAISVLVSNVTNEITVHSLQLDILTAKFISKESKDETKAEIYYCEKDGTSTFRFSRSIDGSGILIASFNGILNNQAVGGFYASKYYSKDELKYSAVTQFEPMNARRAFPCFDEPNMKATFSVSLIVEKHLTALSNMPQISNTSINENECKVSFSKTPIMSTYLLCFVVGEYEFIEKQMPNGAVSIRVFTPIGEKHRASFAINVAERALNYFENYFGVKYPLPKLDLIAIHEFDAGAMENWGLITFKEFLLLSNENSSSTSQKQSIAFVIVHELAHQWFGNLVTMDWWAQLWLNEGFAAFMHTFVTDRLFPEWEFGRQSLIQDYSRALYADSLHNSHAIEMQLNDPSQLFELFDSITYSKSASIIRMLLQWIGEDNFKRGLTLYFNRFKYSNANTKDLWSAFAEVSNKEVDKVMNTWTRQKGYPNLKVIDNGDCKLTVVQSHFTLNKTISDKNTLWKIPIIYTFGLDGKMNEVIIDEKSKTITIPKNRQESGQCDIHLNAGAYGFYRAQYTKEMYERFFERVKKQNLGANERFSLINDLFAFSVANLKSTVDYLQLLEAFQNEEELFVWQSIDQSLSELGSLISNTDCSQSLNKFIRNLMINAFEKLKRRTSSDPPRIMLHSLIMRRLGLSGDETVVKQATEEFLNHYRGIKSIDANFKSSVFTIVASNSNDEIFDKLFELYQRNSNDASERRLIAGAIGFTSDEQQLERVLKFSLSKNAAVSDTIIMVTSVCHCSMGRKKAWDFFVSNFNKFKQRYEGGIEVTNLIKGIVSSFSAFEKADEISRFFEKNKFSGIDSTLRNSLETVRIRSNWLQTDGKNICQFLNNR